MSCSWARWHCGRPSLRRDSTVCWMACSDCCRRWRYTRPSRRQKGILMSSDRTEKASPRRKQKAEQEGDRPRSRELLSAAALLAGSLTLGWSAQTWVPIWTDIYQDTIALMLTPNLSGDALSMSMRNMLVAGAAPC